MHLFAAGLGQLPKLEYAATLPGADPDLGWTGIATRPVSVYAVLTRGSLDERKWELLRKKGAASDLALDGQLIGEREKPIDWNKVLREMRAAGVRASGDELDEHDLRALWERAEGPLWIAVAPNRSRRATLWSPGRRQRAACP